MADVFVSYAREDEVRARWIADALESRGWSVWWDRRIPHGQDFNAQIQVQLDLAKCIVVLWSGAALKSAFVRDEASEGLDGRLVPALLESVRQPLGFRQLQAADLSDWDGGSQHAEFERFIASIATIAPPAPLPSPQSKPALSRPQPAERQLERAGGSAAVFGIAFTLLLLGVGEELSSDAAFDLLTLDQVLESARWVDAVGLAVGGFFGGVLGDRISRSGSLIGGLTAVGCLHLIGAMGPAGHLFLLLRFVTSLAVGVAIPNAVAVAADLSSTRRRALGATLALVGMVVGQLLVAERASPLWNLNWRSGLLVTSLATLAATVGLFRAVRSMPAPKPERTASLQVRDMFGNRRLLLAILFLTASYVLSSLADVLTPSFSDTTELDGGVPIRDYLLLRGREAGLGLGMLAAFSLPLYGRQISLAPLSVASVAACFWLMLNSSSAGATALTLALVIGVEFAVLAFAAQVYPSRYCATGIGIMTSVRSFVPLVFLSFVSWARAGGPNRYFGILAALMTLTLAALMLVKYPGTAHSGVSLQQPDRRNR